jgi:hypothetical protein
MAANTSSARKSNIYIWLTAIILAVATIAVVQYNRKAGEKQLETADRGFTVKSMNDVNKVVIRHVKLQPLIFTRGENNWLLNGTYDVDPGVFVNIEKVLTGMQMLYIPARNATTTILESLKSNGIQVDIYKDEDDKEPVKMFFVGTDTQKGDGTYMILGGSSQPYVMHLPGLAGGLRSRFEQPAINFRDKFIIKNVPGSITSLTMEYPGDYRSSFKISNNNGEWTIQPLLSDNSNTSSFPNQNLIASYASRFEKLGAEIFITDEPTITEVRKNLPAAILTIQNKKDVKKVYRFYGYEDITENKGYAKTPAEIRNQNRLFVEIDSSDMLTAQNRVFSRIFMGLDNFMGKVKN